MLSKNQKKEIVEISWTAPDFEYQPKSAGWYLVSVAIALGLIFFALWQNNFLFAIFVIVGELAVISWAARKPSEWKVEINEKEIKIIKEKTEKRFNLENDFVNFGIRDSTKNFKELLLRKKLTFNPFLEIYFPAEKETEIREMISKVLPEKDYPLSLMDAITKFLGF